MNPIQPIKIIIADDHEFVRTSFKTILQSQYPLEIEFIAEAASGSELIEAVALHLPDIVITDIQMPEMDGIQACREIKERFPSISVLAFSMFTDTHNILGMLKAGATGYLAKTCNMGEIIEGIRSVSRHQSYYCSTISEKLYGTLVNSNQKRLKNKTILFGTQEIKVMRLICRQLSTKEIAVEMCLSPKTVEHYRQNILDKIGARNVVGIAVYALIHELVKYSDLL